LADALQQSSFGSVTELDVRGNRAGNVGADALAKALKSLSHRGSRSGAPGLTSLDISSNFLRSEVQSLAHGLRRACRQSIHIYMSYAGSSVTCGSSTDLRETAYIGRIHELPPSRRWYRYCQRVSWQPWVDHAPHELLLHSK
jgi:hypothetical protein